MKIPKIAYFPIVVVCAGILMWGIYFVYGENKFRRMTNEFKSRSISGEITSAKVSSRGFFLLKINDTISNKQLEYLMPKSWFFTKFRISVGDWVIKDKDSKIMTIFKDNNGAKILCCKYEFGM